MSRRTEVLYVRIPDDLAGWVRAAAEEAGLSIAATVTLLLAWCRQQDVSVNVQVSGR